MNCHGRIHISVRIAVQHTAGCYVCPSAVVKRMSQPQGFLHLLTTIRYVETLWRLYAENKFVIAHRRCLLSLHSALMPQHSSLIREIDFWVRYEREPTRGSPEYQQWIAIWQNIALFTGLKILHFHISVWRSGQSDPEHVKVALLEDVQPIIKSLSSELDVSCILR